MRFLALIALLLTVGACATISEDQCRAGDWERIGFADGADGRDIDFIANHNDACASVGVTPDQSRWLAGREAGLRYYCTPLKAYIEGRRGVVFKRICPASTEAMLRRENRRGLAARQQILDAQRTDDLLPLISPGLLRLPRPILRSEIGITEYEVYRGEILRLRTERILY